MMTPRPDLYTYPNGRFCGVNIMRTKAWLRALFLGGLFGSAALVMVLAAAAV